MENPEEILHSLEEFSKLKPKDIPRELEEYLKFVARTGDPVYQWPMIKSLFREKLVKVITEFYESCASVEIPPCPNVDVFNYDVVKNFILEKLDTFISAPFTIQRICELLTSPRKEYSRIDKYMRALEKNILVVSTLELGARRTENGDDIMNGMELDHEHASELNNEINVADVEVTPTRSTTSELEESTTSNGQASTHEKITEESTVFIAERTLIMKRTSSETEDCTTFSEINIEQSVDATAIQFLMDPNSIDDRYINRENLDSENSTAIAQQTPLAEAEETKVPVSKISEMFEESDQAKSPAESSDSSTVKPESGDFMEVEVTDSSTTDNFKTENCEVSPPHLPSESTPSSTTPPEKQQEEEHKPEITLQTEDNITSSESFTIDSSNEPEAETCIKECADPEASSTSTESEVEKNEDVQDDVDSTSTILGSSDESTLSRDETESRIKDLIDVQSSESDNVGSSGFVESASAEEIPSEVIEEDKEADKEFDDDGEAEALEKDSKPLTLAESPASEETASDLKEESADSVHLV